MKNKFIKIAKYIALGVAIFLMIILFLIYLNLGIGNNLGLKNVTHRCFGITLKASFVDKLPEGNFSVRPFNHLTLAYRVPPNPVENEKYCLGLDSWDGE